jgi:signal transduction histidine kinase
MRRDVPIVIAALAAGGGLVALMLTSDHLTAPGVWAVFAPAVGWSFIGTGLYARHQRPDSRIGMLMVLLGFAWFEFTTQASNSALVYAVALVLGGLWGSIFLHVGISFPSGRVDPGLDRRLVIAGYLIFPLAFVPVALVSGGCERCPENLLLIRDDSDLASVFNVLGALLYAGLFALVLVRSVRHWRAASEFERLQLTPVYTFALLTFLLVTVAQAGVEPAWWAAFVAAGLTPFAFLGGLLRSHLRESHDQVRASRARIVQAGDAARRKLERDLHDGAQSRLVALSLLLHRARRRADGDAELALLLDQAQEELGTGLAELRELARGIHPAVLTDRGLESALDALVARAPVAVTLEVGAIERLPGPIESAVYFVVSEGLTNVAKYAQATQASVTVRCGTARVTVEVADDGVGGADAAHGSGLRGLADRLAALDGRLSVNSPAGRGTRLRAELPISAQSGPPARSR